jgi:apolipoprotein N-acyltransferase
LVRRNLKRDRFDWPWDFDVPILKTMPLIGSPASAAAAIVAGAMLGLSFHAPGLTFFSWAGLAVIAVLVRRADLKIVPAYAAGITFQLVGLSWMTTCYSSQALTENRIVIWLGLGLYFGLIFPIVVSLGCHLRKYWPMWAVMPVIWTLGDLLRFESGRLIVGPFPWLTLGYSQTGFLSACQLADLGGVWAVGFFAAMLGGAVADVIEDRRLPTVAVIVIVAATAYGATRMRTSFLDGPSVALMPAREANVPQADIALWSEAAFEGHQPLSALCTTIQGCRRREKEGVFNSAIIETDGGVTFCYDKCNVVPYFESQFTPGDQLVSFESDGYKVGVAICYDASFGKFMRELADCDFTVVLGNESFDPTMQLANQMFSMGQIRAIEMRRAIVRNANGGHSGAIDGNGVGRPIELWEPTIVSVPLDNRVSPYAFLGDWLPLACLLAVLCTIGQRPPLQRVPRAAGNVVEDESHGAMAP